MLNRHIVNVNKRNTTCDDWENLGLCLININLSILLSFEICLKWVKYPFNDARVGVANEKDDFTARHMIWFSTNSPRVVVLSLSCDNNIVMPISVFVWYTTLCYNCHSTFYEGRIACIVQRNVCIASIWFSNSASEQTHLYHHTDTPGNAWNPDSPIHPHSPLSVYSVLQIYSSLLCFVCKLVVVRVLEYSVVHIT